MKNFLVGLTLAVSLVPVIGTSIWQSSPLQSASAHSLGTSVQPSVNTADVLLSQRRRRRRYRFTVGYSRYRRAGISRGSACPADTVAPVTPVVDPAVNNEQISATTYLGTSAHPTFFIRVPELPDTRLKLTVQPVDVTEPMAASASKLAVPEEISYGETSYESVIYEAEYPLESQAGGIVGLRSPLTAPPLEVGTQYLWQVSIFCQPDSASPMQQDDGMILEGGILQRVEDTTQGLAAERFEQYAEQGIWQEALSTVAEAYYQNPENATAAQNWRELMESVGLSDFASQPVVAIQTGTLLSE